MAKIIERIEGYAELTDAEKIKAVEALEESEPDFTGYIKKDRFDKVTSEVADLKKQLREKMSEAEQAEADRATKEQEKDELLNKLLKEKTVSETTAKFLGIGYDEGLAKETAEAFVSGDNNKVFANQQKFLEIQKKKWEEKTLDKTPEPPAGGKETGGTMTRERLLKLGLNERQKFATENPSEFQKLTQE